MINGGEGYIHMKVYKELKEQLNRIKDEHKYAISQRAAMQQLYYQEKKTREKKDKDATRYKQLWEDQKSLNTNDREFERNAELKMQQKEFTITDLKNQVLDLRLARDRWEEHYNTRSSEL